MISLAVEKLREVKKPPIQVSSSGFVTLFVVQDSGNTLIGSHTVCSQKFQHGLVRTS